MLIFLQSIFLSLIPLYLVRKRKIGTLLMLTIVMFFYSNYTVYASDAKFDSGRSHHIRISVSLSNYDIGVKGVKYTLVKYEDSKFEKPTSTYDFEPTILKEVREAFTSNKGSTAYKGISPDIYEATPGYYEIYQILSNDDGYYNPGRIRFKIDTKGVFEAINMPDSKQNYELNTGIMYDPEAKSYEPDGKIRKDYTGQRTYYYNFKVSTSNKLILHKRASSYNSKGLLPIGEEFFDVNNTAYFQLYVLQEDTKEWLKISNPNSADMGNEEIAGCFPVEIEKYGGGLRDNFGELINYFYKYNFDLGLTPNMVYKFEEKYTPTNYRKNKDGEVAPMFTFFIKTDENSKIIYAKMDKDTYNYYSVAYHYIFNKDKDDISRDLIIENNVYKNSFPGLNIDRRTNVSTVFLLNIDSRDVEETSSFNVSDSVNDVISYVIPKSSPPPFTDDNTEALPMPNITSSKPTTNITQQKSQEDTNQNIVLPPAPTVPDESAESTEEPTPEESAPELDDSISNFSYQDQLQPAIIAENPDPIIIQEPNDSQNQYQYVNAPIDGVQRSSQEDAESTSFLLLALVILTGAACIVYTNKDIFFKQRTRNPRDMKAIGSIRRSKKSKTYNLTKSFNRILNSLKG